MSKTAVITELREKHGYSKTDAEVAFESVIGTIKTIVQSGGEVRAAGFGTFKMKHSPARSGRNPITGATLAIPAKNAISFKPSKPSA